jgi:hypothetical protein
MPEARRRGEAARGARRYSSRGVGQGSAHWYEDRLPSEGSEVAGYGQTEAEVETKGVVGKVISI